MLLEVVFAMCTSTWTWRKPEEHVPTVTGEASTNAADLRIFGDQGFFQCVYLEESRPSRSEDELKYHALRLLTATPGMDDVELADALGETPFDVARLLRKLAEEGMIEEAP